MTKDEFYAFEGDLSSLSDLDILPLLFVGIPSTDRMISVVSQFRSLPLYALKELLRLSDSLEGGYK